jgi:CheY-like chemotaxis protein
VTVERDGVAALQRAMRQAFYPNDLDIHMPVLDGYTLCAELRASGIRGPIIALSAAALPNDVERGKDFGFDAYLTKPLRPADLRAAVRRFQPDADRGGIS